MSQGGLTVGVAELEFLRDQANRAAGAEGKAVVIPELSDGVSVAVLHLDGSLSRNTKRRPARVVEFASLSEFPAILEQARIGAVESSHHPEAKPTVYVSRYGVAIIWDDSDSENGRARDRSLYQYSKHDEIESLGPDGIKNYDQRRFLNTLRRDFKLALGELATSLIPAVASMKWQTGQRGTMTVSHGRESMGREIDSEIQSTVGAIPEEVVLHLLLTDDLEIPTRYPVRCLLDIDPAQQTFSLIPAAGEVERAWNFFRNDVAAYLREKAPDYLIVRGERVRVIEESN